MDDDLPQITELDQGQAEEIAQKARESIYYTHLIEFLSDHLGEDIPPENVWTYEIYGTRLVAFTDSSDHDQRPSIGITFEFEQDQITHAVAEVSASDSTRKQTLIYISELESPEKVMLSDDRSEVSNIQGFENVTVYEIGDA